MEKLRIQSISPGTLGGGIVTTARPPSTPHAGRSWALGLASPLTTMKPNLFVSLSKICLLGKIICDQNDP